MANANVVKLIYCGAEKAITHRQTKSARSSRAVVLEPIAFPRLLGDAKSIDLSSQLTCDKAKRPSPDVATNYSTGLDRIQHGQELRRAHFDL